MKFTGSRLPPSVIGAIVIGAFILGTVAGYILRINQEDVVGAKIALKDMEVVEEITNETESEQRNANAKKAAVKQQDLPDCLTAPLPFDF